MKQLRGRNVTIIAALLFVAAGGCADASTPNDEGDASALDADGDAAGGANTNSNADPNSNGNGNGNVDPNPDPNADPQPSPDPDPDPNGDPGPGPTPNPDPAPTSSVAPGGACQCDSDCTEVQGGFEPVCVFGICMTLASAPCSAAGSSGECPAGMRCWSLQSAADALCWPDCDSFNCDGECDGDGSCVMTMNSDSDSDSDSNSNSNCDAACGVYCNGGSVDPQPDPGPDPGSDPDPGPGPDLPPDAGVNAAVDIRADVNRDGVASLTDAADDAAEDTWDAAHGAVFLANIDDDQNTCPKTGSDAYLAACNDAADDVVNGTDDLLDMAPLVIGAWPGAPDGAYGALTINAAARTRVRLFRRSGDSYQVFLPNTDTLSTAALRAGAELRLEGKDVVRDSAVWDGYVDLTFTVVDPGADVAYADTVRLRVAPVITRHHMDAPETFYVSAPVGLPGETAFLNDFGDAVEAAGVNDVTELNGDLQGDPWAQDYFETAYMATPSPSGMHVMHVNIRSANVYNPGDRNYPLRSAGRSVFTELRGPDVAGLQQYDINHDPNMDSLDSFGNTETIPPYSYGDHNYPLGRLFRGSIPNFHPDAKMSKLFESQGVQPPVYVDTSWLLVGHVDETISFVRADNARGWTLLVNDAALAKAMLEEQERAGNGAVKMFVGKRMINDWGAEQSAAISISSVLQNSDVMAASAEAVVEVDDQIAILKQAIGFTDDELLRSPFLHESVYGASVAYQPGTVNGVSLGSDHYASPETLGPRINGVDIFETQLEDELAKVDVQVHWVENWDLLHRNMGEVHCGSNTKRQVPVSTKWWEEGSAQ